MSQFTCNRVTFRVSWGHTGHFAKISQRQALVVQLVTHTLLDGRVRRDLFNCASRGSLLCTKEPRQDKVHSFLSEVQICMFKHSVAVLPVEAWWLKFKHIFAFESCEKEENIHLIKEMLMSI